MRKTLIGGNASEAADRSANGWLKLDAIARVEVTSEHWNFPIEAALTPEGAGWRAAEPGQQLIRLIFDEPMALHRIHLEFYETEHERTQEFTLRAASNPTGSFSDIVRQQWNFSPRGSTREIEDYAVDLHDVRVLELVLEPAVGAYQAVASLACWQLA